PVLADHRAGGGACSFAIEELEGLGPLVLRGHIDAEYGAEELVAHRGALLIGCYGAEGVDEVADALVVLTPGNDAHVLLVLLQAIDVGGDAVEGFLIDHGVDEVAQVAGFAHAEGSQVGEQLLLHRWPEVGGDVCTAGGAALLALE